MSNLGTAAVRTWHRNLPPDVKSVVPDDVGPDDARMPAMYNALASAPLNEAAAILRQNDALVAGMGRARRVWLMAWLMNRVGDDEQKLADFLAIFDEDEGSGDGGARPIGARLLYEDVRLLTDNVVAPRVSRLTVNPAALEIVLRSSLAAVLENNSPPGGL